jgi:hypothetical protein
MVQLNEKSREAIESLLAYDVDDLFAELGAAFKAVQTGPIPDGKLSALRSDLAAVAPLERTDLSLVDFGKDVFDRMKIQAHQLVCGGDPNSQANLDDFLESLGLGEAAVVAALTALLLAAKFWTWPAWVATLVATTIVKLFFRPVFEEFCERWTESLASA